MPRVLVPTDFSEAAWLVTREAASWVTAMHGELILLHVVPDLVLSWLDHPAIAFIDQTRLAAAYEELHEQGQRNFAAWLPYPDSERCRKLVVVGNIADAIISVAQVEIVDLIIMPAAKRRWWRALLPGSVTNTVMRRASVPVAVWAGLERKAGGGFWQGVRCRHAWDSAWEGLGRERQSASIDGSAQVVALTEADRDPLSRDTRSAKRSSIEG
jgi:nucleotide-binding universal stress UspA family protein